MKLVNQYIIRFKGLKEGEHNFTFDLSSEFFEEFSVLEIQDGKLVADVILNKKSTLLELDFHIHGTISLPCDRCLELIDYTFNYKGSIFAKFSDKTDESTDDVWIIHPNDDEIDLKHYFMESIGLNIPIQKFHPDRTDGTPGCKSEMLEYFDQDSSNDQQDDEIDPRWSKLKDLYKDNNKSE